MVNVFIQGSKAVNTVVWRLYWRTTACPKLNSL